MHAPLQREAVRCEGDNCRAVLYAFILQVYYNMYYSVRVQIVDRAELSIQEDAAFRNEVRVLKLLSRDKAVRPDYVDRVSQIEAFYKDKNRYHLVLEPLVGGMLFDRIHKQDAYSEFKAREVIRAVLQAVRACHDNGIGERVISCMIDIV